MYPHSNYRSTYLVFCREITVSDNTHKLPREAHNHTALYKSYFYIHMLSMRNEWASPASSVQRSIDANTKQRARMRRTQHKQNWT